MRSAQRGCATVLWAAGLTAFLLASGCAPVFPGAHSPADLPPTEYMWGEFRLPAGTILRYQEQTSFTGTAGQSPPTFRETATNSLVLQVLSVDPDGTVSIRLDENETPLLLGRIQRDGTLVDVRSQSGDIPRQKVEDLKRWLATIMPRTPSPRLLRVGDAVPFLSPVPIPEFIPGVVGGTGLVGTLLLTRFSPIGRCWTADLQGVIRPGMPAAGEATEPQAGKPFRLDEKTLGEMTVEYRGRHEIQAGVEVESQTVMRLRLTVTEASGRPPFQPEVIGTIDRRLNSGSLSALGC